MHHTNTYLHFLHCNFFHTDLTIAFRHRVTYIWAQATRSYAFTQPRQGTLKLRVSCLLNWKCQYLYQVYGNRDTNRWERGTCYWQFWVGMQTILFPNLRYWYYAFSGSVTPYRVLQQLKITPGISYIYPSVSKSLGSFFLSDFSVLNIFIKFGYFHSSATLVNDKD